MTSFIKSIQGRTFLTISFLVLLTSTVITTISLKEYTTDSVDFTKSMLRENNEMLAFQIQSQISQLVERVRVWGNLATNQTSPTVFEQALNNDSTVLAFQIYKNNPTKGQFELSFQASKKGAPELEQYRVSFDTKIFSTSNAVIYRKSTLSGNLLTHEIIAPLRPDEQKIDTVIVAMVDSKFYLNLFNNDGETKTFLTNSVGNVLYESATSPKQSWDSKNNDILNKITEIIATNSTTQGQATVNKHLVSFSKIPVANLSIISIYPESVLYTIPFKILRQSILLGLALLGFAFLFSISFTKPIEKSVRALTNGFHKISSGEVAEKIETPTQTELALLSNSFNNMVSELNNREQLKSLNGKFANLDIARKLFDEGKINFEGNRVPVTVLYADVRAFTIRSESMAPEEAIGMLNDYLAVMVPVIEKHEGMIDKIVGDSITVVWGIQENDPPSDALHAVSASIEMRERLEELNRTRIGHGQIPIQIGMGVTSGSIIAGNIGMPGKEEYTIIGETVNIAANLESLTKEFGQDILLSESTYKLLPPYMYDFFGPWRAQPQTRIAPITVYGIQSPEKIETTNSAA